MLTLVTRYVKNANLQEIKTPVKLLQKKRMREENRQNLNFTKENFSIRKYGPWSPD